MTSPLDRIRADFRDGLRVGETLWPRHMRALHIYTGTLVTLAGHTLIRYSQHPNLAQQIAVDASIVGAFTLSAVLNRLAHASREDFAHTASVYGEHPLDHPLVDDGEHARQRRLGALTGRDARHERR